MCLNISSYMPHTDTCKVTLYCVCMLGKAQLQAVYSNISTVNIEYTEVIQNINMN